MPADVNRIVDQYNLASIRTPWIRAIAQIVGYMSIEHVCCGVLSTFNKTYGDTAEYAEDDRDEDAGGNISSSRTTGKRKRKVSVATDQETDSVVSFSANEEEEPLWFGDVVLGKTLGQGRMGIVKASVLDGTEVAIKIVDVSKKGSDALNKERARYRELSHLQGLCIPLILRYSFGTDTGIVDGFVMQKLRTMPDDFEAWTSDELSKSKDALQMLKDRAGLVQCDLRGANFGLEADTGRVLVLDLEQLV